MGVPLQNQRITVIPKSRNSFPTSKNKNLTSKPRTSFPKSNIPFLKSKHSFSKIKPGMLYTDKHHCCTEEYKLYQLPSHLFDMSELRTMRESSISEITSEVSSPRSNSSPRFLNGLKAKFCTLQSATTCFSLASMSFSFTALIQMSYTQATKGT